MHYFNFVKVNIRWLFAGMVLTFFSALGQTYFISLFSEDIRGYFNLTHGDFGIIYMFATLASAASLIFLGKITDYWPVAVVSAITLSGLAMVAFGMYFVSAIWMLWLAIYGLRLFGQGMCTHVAMTAMGKWYAKDRGRAVSVTTLGHQFGEGVIPPLIVALIALVGWRFTWVYAALVAFLFALPVVVLLMRVERIPRNAPPEPEMKAQRHWTLSEAIRDPYIYIIGLAVMAPAFIGTSTFFHQIHLAEIKGWSKTILPSNQYFLAIFAIASILIWGWLVDKYSAVRLLPFFLVALGAGSIMLATQNTPYTVPIYLALLGITFGSSNCLFGALWPEIYGTKYLGSIRSVLTAIMVFASAMGPGLTGKLIDWGVGFEFQNLIMGIYCFIVTIVMIPVSRKCMSRMKRDQAEFDKTL